jgi:2-polyprenyl-3-methyl-5-hydroxy-6-metoxy-1,4-benzoquinol methylase
MSKFSRRSTDPEIMDDLACSGEVVNKTLREIDTINRWLGGNAITWHGIATLLDGSEPKESLHIADIGCGSGDMLKLICTKLSTKCFQFNATGFDANPHIVAYARENCRDYGDITFHTENILDSTFLNRTFDVITATLFLHHFTDDQLIQILKNLVRQARIGIVINDLHRHPLAYHSIRLLTRLFSRSSMVKYDAPLSVLRGFRRREWAALLETAGILNYSMKWGWAFRWQVIIRTSELE